MFGLENKKNGAKPFVFDLEKELKNPSRQKELKDKVETRIQNVKNILRGGENQEEYDHLGVLLHGYTALLKVMGKVTK